ncbi:MAG TPA: hypothetical protein V6C85_21995 [Allocoleopsis sp.]
MSKLYSFRLSEDPTRPPDFLENYSTKTAKKKLTPLSAIWVKEFDGEREYLVARWVKQD